MTLENNSSLIMENIKNNAGLIMLLGGVMVLVVFFIDGVAISRRPFCHYDGGYHVDYRGHRATGVCDKSGYGFVLYDYGCFDTHPRWLHAC